MKEYGPKRNNQVKRGSVLTELRHKLHKYPELSGKEKETAGIIVDFVRRYKPDKIYKNVGGYGVAVCFNYGETGPTVMIRCDLDALPINEATYLEYKSRNKGVSHKCGHDGHMTIVAGLAPWLNNRPFKKGRVILLFQPAEETGEGADAVLNDPVFNCIKPDYVFALHNLPGYPRHSIIVADGQMTPTVLSLAIKVEGHKSHAAQPQNGINPTLALSTLNMAICKLANSEISDHEYSLITPVHTLIGTRDYGISPGEGELHFTIRTLNEEQMHTLRDEINRVVADTCVLHRLKYEIEESDYFPTVLNNEDSTGIVIRAAVDIGLEVLKLDKPLEFGEDFGFFSRNYKSTLFGLGLGKEAIPLHHKEYDFKDEVIETGLEIFKKIVAQILSV